MWKLILYIYIIFLNEWMNDFFVRFFDEYKIYLKKSLLHLWSFNVSLHSISISFKNIKLYFNDSN